jgi:hypothetical protein
MTIKETYICDYCEEDFKNKNECIQHEQECLFNKDVWELQWRDCDENCWYAKADRCAWNEHCDHRYTVRVNKKTGEVRY